MLSNFRKRLGLAHARWRFRKEEEPRHSLTDFIQSAKSFLIVLPSTYEEALIAGTTLKKLFDVLKNRHLTIVTTGIRATALSGTTKSEVIRIDEVDINTFFLPRKSLMKRVLVRPYDVAIDLNLDFVLHAAYICRASHAPIRVGIMHEAGELFFNVQFNLNQSALPQVVYEKFVRCLEMF